MTNAVTAESPRFEFGANWSRFLRRLDTARICQAEASLREAFGPSLSGKRFLDVGSGSGLFSLAARRLGATVHSFDFDPLSVRCAEELRQRFFPGDSQWTIEQGSVLDMPYMASLGTFDLVYSWGVLHHTGDMWRALDATCAAVRPGGMLCVAIYNDQGTRSLWWKRMKRTYNRLPRALKAPYLLSAGMALEVGALVLALARLQPGRFVSRWTQYDSVRGMSRWHDVVDWVGGYPFEVAKPEDVFGFCRARGFALSRLVTCGGRMGCNEFVLVRAE
jgi:2-polyprenyl-6-hydroxyphenyl methylase/3-demethylubiquinone-9 3-methyltransferase